MGDADRDGLPVADGRSGVAMTLPTVPAIERSSAWRPLSSPPLNLMRRGGPGPPSNEDHLRVGPKSVTGEQSGHERPNDNIHASASTC